MFPDLRRSVEGVGVEHGLDHDEGLGQVLPVEVVSVVGAFIRTVVKDLKKRGAPQVEHELQRKGQNMLEKKAQTSGHKVISRTSPEGRGRRSLRT